jgi:DNA polymerase elongation subunit (family B)
MLDLDEYVITKSVGDVSGDYDQETSKLGSYKVKSLADDPAKRELQLKGKSEREFYMSSCPPQVRLADRMKARGFPVEPGTRIEYVVLNRTGAKSQGDKIEELQYFKDHKNILRIDPVYYLESLQKPLDQLFKAGLGEPFMSVLARYRLEHHKTVQQLKNKLMPRIVETI